MNDALASSRRSPLVATCLTACLAALVFAGCARKEEPAPEAMATQPAGGEQGGMAAPGGEPAPAAEGAPQLIAVDLPDAFPRDLPMPPAGTVTEVAANRDGETVQANAAVAVQQEAAALFGWYKQALAGGGWTIDNEGQSGTTRQLHAVKGDATIDLTVDPDADFTGWSRAHVSVYMPGAGG